MEKMDVGRTKRARTKEVTGLLHISDRLLAGELSRVEAVRGTLQSLLDRIDNDWQIIVSKMLGDAKHLYL